MALRHTLDHDGSIHMQVDTNLGATGLILVSDTGIQTHPAMLQTQAATGNAPDHIFRSTRFQIDRYPLCLEQQKCFFLTCTRMSLTQSVEPLNKQVF